MRKLCFFALACFIISGCAGHEQQPASPQRKVSSAAGAQAQYKAAQKAFQEKLDAAPGLTLAALRTRWGQVQQGITHNNSTIYSWTQTITVTPPTEGASGALPPRNLSCMAVFIFRGGVVVEASSEGHCVDQSLMPAWRPLITTAT
ncbi:MAG: hypothetical protein FWG97_02945 [Deltaproteobacteria bacterium]|nr:hypothetical protein [Deltaproteobacteria bacterium]